MADDHNLPAKTSSEIRTAANSVAISGSILAPRSLAEVMDFGQLMAKAGPMVGKPFRGKPGACVAIIMQSMRWNMDSFAVSQKAYVISKGGDDEGVIAYEAQLVNAVINANAPIIARPDYRFEGDGPTRKCTVTATFRGESKPKEYTSPESGKITTKNSPLWKTDLDQQLGYYSLRAWARRHCPEIIMGVYTVDEMKGEVVLDGGEISAEPIARVASPQDEGPVLQDSAQWAEARIGCVTASRVADVIAKSQSGAASASRTNYAAQLVAERLTGQPTETYVSAAMQWGLDNEPLARAAYEALTGAPVGPAAFVLHPSIQWAGATPDGFVGDDGLVEFKCPNTATHIETLTTQKIPAKYVTQMQWQMACTGRAWCDFASFDPRMPPARQLFIKRLARDDAFIAGLESAVAEFLKEIDATLADLTSGGAQQAAATASSEPAPTFEELNRALQEAATDQQLAAWVAKLTPDVLATLPESERNDLRAAYKARQTERAAMVSALPAEDCSATLTNAAGQPSEIASVNPTPGATAAEADKGSPAPVSAAHQMPPEPKATADEKAREHQFAAFKRNVANALNRTRLMEVQTLFYKSEWFVMATEEEQEVAKQIVMEKLRALKNAA